jgi:hypothetical protein
VAAYGGLGVDTVILRSPDGDQARWIERVLAPATGRLAELG